MTAGTPRTVNPRPWENRPARLPAGVTAAAGAGIGTGAGYLICTGVFLAISRFHQQIGILNTIRAPMIVTLLAAVALLASTRRWRPGDIAQHWIPKYIGVIALFAVAGIPFAINRTRSLMFVTDAFSRTLLLAVMAWALARTPAGARQLARAIAFSGFVASVLALYRGRIDNEGRLAGAATYDSNDLALVLVLCLPLVLWWILDKTNRLRYFGFAFLLPMLFAIMKTGSRGGFLGLAAILVAFVVVGGAGIVPHARRYAIVVAVAAVASIPFLPSTYMERITSMANYQDDYNSTSPRGRIQIWKRGMGYMVTHPVFGVGIDNFPVAEGRLSDAALARQAGEGLKWSAAHNSFVQLAAELGIIPGVLFILLVLKTAITLLKRGKALIASRAPDLLTPLLGLCFVGYGVGGFFLSFAYYDIVYFLFALATALLMSPASGGQPAAARPRPMRGQVPVQPQLARYGR